jgi:hypothetical protein
LPVEVPESLTSPFNEEIIKSVFNGTKRGELCIDEEDILSIKRSDRGFSIDEGPELSLEEFKNCDEEMKLKKTTVLTGNHLVGTTALAAINSGGKSIRTRA